MRTFVLLTLGAYGCGDAPPLDIKGCWYNEDRFAEIGYDHSTDWKGLWKRWHRWLVRGDPACLIHVSIHPQSRKKRKLRKLVGGYKNVIIRDTWSREEEDVEFFAPVGRYNKIF